MNVLPCGFPLQYDNTNNKISGNLHFHCLKMCNLNFPDVKVFSYAGKVIFCEEEKYLRAVPLKNPRVGKTPAPDFVKY